MGVTTVHTEPPRSRPVEALGSLVAVLLCVVSAAAAAGVWDLAENAVGFSVLESIETVLLWSVLGAALAIPACLAAAVLCLVVRASPSAVCAAVVWAVLQGGILAGSKSGWFGVPLALLASAAVLLLGALLRRASDPLAAARRRCPWVAVAVLAATVVIGFVRPGYPRIPSAKVTPSGGAGTDRPNVVVIVLDTLRADHLGAYGDPRGLSPGFDALAERSTVFEDAFANAPWTVPSHASLFTGLPPRTHGATTLHHRWLDDRFTTLAEALGGRGYRTAIFSANRYLREANLAQGFEIYRPIGERFEALWIRSALEVLGVPARWADHGACEGVDAVEDFLEDLGANSGPVFLFVNLMEPHWRYLPPVSDRGALLPGEIGLVEATRVSLRFYGPLAMASGKAGEKVDGVLRAFYAAAVRYQDRQLSRLVEVVDDELGRENTVLVVTSDHGENLGEAGRYDHVFAVNDHLIRVPLLVRYPPSFPEGKRVGGLCELADVPATIAELVAGARLGEGTTGKSLVPGRFAPRPFVVVEGDPYYGHFERMASVAGFQRDVGDLARPLLAIRTRDRKLVLQGRSAPRLYDVARDRDEVKDVLSVEPGMAEELSRELEKWLGEVPAYVRQDAPASAPLSPEALERFMRLGYTGR